MVAIAHLVAVVTALASSALGAPALVSDDLASTPALDVVPEQAVPTLVDSAAEIYYAAGKLGKGEDLAALEAAAAEPPLDAYRPITTERVDVTQLSLEDQKSYWEYVEQNTNLTRADFPEYHEAASSSALVKRQSQNALPRWWPPRYIRAKNKNTWGVRMCVDKRDHGQWNGCPIQIWQCSSGQVNMNQLWLHMDNGQLRVYPTQQLPNYGYQHWCIDTGTSRYAGAKMKLWHCYDYLPAQSWELVKTTNGGINYRLMNTNYCLDMPYGNMWNGQQLQIYYCSWGNLSQSWDTCSMHHPDDLCLKENGIP